jgi:hypothetical protein
MGRQAAVGCVHTQRTRAAPLRDVRTHCVPTSTRRLELTLRHDHCRAGKHDVAPDIVRVELSAAEQYEHMDGADKCSELRLEGWTR